MTLKLPGGLPEYLLADSADGEMSKFAAKVSDVIDDTLRRLSVTKAESGKPRDEDNDVENEMETIYMIHNMDDTNVGSFPEQFIINFENGDSDKSMSWLVLARNGIR